MGQEHARKPETGLSVRGGALGDDLADVQVVDLELYDGARFDTAMDSLSRLKAAYAANQAMPVCVDGRRTSVRVWIADDEQAAAVAHAYNQEGAPVNATAAKYRHQDTPAQMLARRLMDRSPHLGMRNIEVLGNSPSKNSPKLASFNTLVLAIENSWTHTPLDGNERELDAQADWLVQAWDALVAVRPEFGCANLKQRQEWRQSSVAGTTASIHRMVAVFCEIYPGTNFSDLTKLKAPVPLVDSSGAPVFDGGGQPRSVDFFGNENPIWLSQGILVQGKSGLLNRMSFNTPRTMTTILRGQAGI